MQRLLTIILFISFPIFSFCQTEMLVVKKKYKTINQFWKGNFIAFSTGYDQWHKGEIMEIKKDSFFIRPMVATFHLMGSDTTYFPIERYSLADVKVMPKKGYLIDFVKGRWYFSRSGGHVHFYWIKSGWLFRTGAIGYAGLNLLNGIIQNNFTKADIKVYAIAGGVYLFGVFLKHAYKPYFHLGKKYKIINPSYSH